MQKKVRVIAFYLPQFHPIPENDLWWGKGFTEWTNVCKAKPLFWKHYQPRIPSDLGFYDLRVSETREAQADMAREAGIEGFCYWHYWFGDGKRLLERPFSEVLISKKPDFPFCLAWANESWKGFAHGLKNRNVLIEQKYLGLDDYKEHFYAVLPAFRDSRYITVEGKPLFVIYKPFDSPEVISFIKVWRELAEKNGLSGIYFVGHNSGMRYSVEDILSIGFDGVNTLRLRAYMHKERNLIRKIVDKLTYNIFKWPSVYSYSKVSSCFLDETIDRQNNVFPSAISGWDHTPRSGNRGLVLTNFTPELFKKHFADVVEVAKDKPIENRLIFLKSWNEWAEGNYVEPDQKYGNSFLHVIKKVLD